MLSQHFFSLSTTAPLMPISASHNEICPPISNSLMLLLFGLELSCGCAFFVIDFINVIRHIWYDRIYSTGFFPPYDLSIFANQMWQSFYL